MKKSWYVHVLALAVIIASASALFLFRELDARTLPFAVSEPVTPLTQMPEGMVLKTYDSPADAPLPTIALAMSEDSMGGWTIHAKTTDFVFAPEHMNGDPLPGEGHVHLYIDDNLIIMPGPWYHLASLAPGAHTIRVALFNNDHSIYAHEGTYIEDEETIHVSTRDDHMLMEHQ